MLVPGVWLVMAYGRVKGRANRRRVRAICDGYGRLAAVVLMLELRGYHCRITRLDLGRGRRGQEARVI